MAALSKAEITGKKSARAKLLFDKIKKKDKFILFEGEAEVLLEFEGGMKSTAAMAFASKRYADIPKGKIFVVIDGKEKTEFPTLLALSGIKKTKEFGSSKGSGGGADATAATESMGCYYAAYLFNSSVSKYDPNKSYGEELSQFFTQNPKFVDAYDKKKKLSFQDCWDFWVNKLGEDAEWMDTFIATANKIKLNASEFTGDVYFHRGSPFMDSIYARKKKCEKHNKDLIKSGTATAELKESIASFSDDKWNPGDIWMSTVNPNIMPYQPFSWQPKFMSKNMQQHVCDWPSLQTAVYQSAISGETLGISLKKTGKDASLQIFNSKDPEAKKDKIQYKGYRFGSGDFFNSADMYIEFNNGSMQYRATASTSSWQGEVKGTKASGGKCGGGPTNYYSELYFDRSIDKTKKLESGTWKEKKGKITPADKKKMHELYLKYNENQKVEKNKIAPTVSIEKTLKNNPYDSLSNDFKRSENKNKLIYTSTKDSVSLNDFLILGDNFGKNKAANFYFGKYMALVFVDTIESGTLEKRNQFATEVIRYAMSNIDNVSTYFWKIY
ncbi:MAG: hypothetical protein H8D92_00835 [Pelagibacteraceae bacterium]|jgi:hypothetical protein|nr:hypothetical protein [Pelagibacteraceae bacterium]|tara:strand:+ start:41 stop:1702 length:1662 start_codon:yes stop_codon:yes gene_type:complete